MKQLKTMLILLSLFLIVVGCSDATEEEETAVNETAPPATEVAQVETIPPTATKEEPTETPTAEPTAMPTAVPEPTEEPTPEVVELVMDNCMICHSDKEMLIQVANPEEEKEPGESSGVG